MGVTNHLLTGMILQVEWPEISMSPLEGRESTDKRPSQMERKSYASEGQEGKRSLKYIAVDVV